MVINTSKLICMTEEPDQISVQCKQPHDPWRNPCPVPLVASFFQGMAHSPIILTEGVGGALRFPLHIWYSNASFKKEAPVNRAIMHLTKNAGSRVWYGTVIVLKFKGVRRRGYGDAGLNDLAALSAYFLSE